MKITKKRFIILMLVGLMVITFFALKSETQASENLYYATVVSAGPWAGNAFICLTATNGSFTGQYMVAPSGQANQFLATALTAMSLGKYVLILAVSVSLTISYH